MKRMFLAILVLLWSGVGDAQRSLLLRDTAAAPPFVPNCSQSTTYLAALTAPTTAEKQAYDAAICGMVSDGDFASLFFLHILANTSDANAKVNAVSPGTFNLTENGTCTFTADRGITGDGTTCYLATGFIPSTNASGALNTLAGGACVLTSRTAVGNNSVEMGAAIGTSYFYFQPQVSGSFNYDVNGFSFPGSLQANAQGAWAIARTSSTSVSAFKAGTSFNTTTDNSIALPTVSVSILALNTNGTQTDFSSDQLGYDYVGTLSAAAIARVTARLSTMMTALGNSAC